MPQLTPVRTGLDVGFGGKPIPDKFKPLQGNVWRSIPAVTEFPFEDAQFEAVVLDGAIVTVAAVREAHRVLKPNGHLYFEVPEKTARQDGFTLPAIYAIVREGYNIVDVDRPKWRWFGFGERTFTIRACKKNWSSLRGATYRPYV